ncbi:MAG: PIN domain-containing protein [Gemmatimonadetes bacterium]|nr:PIN domain-containing protein [Gemmatimonadota bacterium]
MLLRYLTAVRYHSSVDSGAWIALALTRDPLHVRVVDIWHRILELRARLYTSAPVVLETFTFLGRNASRDVALTWKEALKEVGGLSVLGCSEEEVELAWKYFERRDLHKLSAVDATSFVLMRKQGIKPAFSFDHHLLRSDFKLSDSVLPYLLMRVYADRYLISFYCYLAAADAT